MSFQQIAARLQLPLVRRNTDRRKSFRIDPEFQNRFRLRILALALAISLLGAIASLGAAYAFGLVATSHDRTPMQILVVALALGAGLLIIFACDRLSHRYCGPVYRIQKTLEAIRRGERPEPIHLRGDDEFVELAHLLNLALVELGAMQAPVDRPGEPDEVRKPID